MFERAGGRRFQRVHLLCIVDPAESSVQVIQKSGSSWVKMLITSGELLVSPPSQRMAPENWEIIYDQTQHRWARSSLWRTDRGRPPSGARHGEGTAPVQQRTTRRSTAQQHRGVARIQASGEIFCHTVCSRRNYKKLEVIIEPGYSNRRWSPSAPGKA